MAKKLFIGNLPYSATNSQLEELFSKAGQVVSANVIIDRLSGRGRGFGFVEMLNDDEANKAIQMYNGYNLEGRPLIVNEARPQEPRYNQGQRSYGRDFRGDNRRKYSRPRR